ncbi:integrase [Ruegeria phage vB_RpoS-V16]|uniref:integrase n=1 Tax=Ruegeria phage vB_RpoS-V16 TaxID=2218618 RepID=UPI000DCACA8F|nr:integrase [Ruegeria phage vB_RpoS-V16]AWY09503.1 integrase [Ruegeria phage vB_RpoS-V16]
MPLTETAIKKAPVEGRKYKMIDGLGLSVEVRPTGVKMFVKQYRFGGRQRSEMIGEFPGVNLAAARARTLEINDILKHGGDPSDTARNRRLAKPRAGEPEERETFVPEEQRFETIADRFIDKREAEGVAQATLNKLHWNLGVAKRRFAGRDIASIKPPEILKLVEEVQATGKLEKAKDIHRKLSQVFQYAIGLGAVDLDPAQMIKRAVVKKPGGCHPGLTEPRAVGGLIRAIRGYTGQPETRAALMLSAYTVLRSTELRAARWGEIDLDAALWTVPGDRMKGRYGDHLVPLPRQAVEILEGLREWQGVEDEAAYIFPCPAYYDRHMSNATLNAAIRRLGYDTRREHCHHGFRTTFSTNMNEQGWNRDWIERQLCHVDQDEVRLAYNKALYLDGRREMMQAYADWLDQVGQRQ